MDFSSYDQIEKQYDKNKDLMNLLDLSLNAKESFNLKQYIPNYGDSKFCHYRGKTGTNGIIRNNKLRFGSIMDMNDKNELKYTKCMAKNCFNNLFPYENSLYDTFCRALDSAPTDYYIISGSSNDHSQALKHYGNFVFKFDKFILINSLDAFRKHYNDKYKTDFIKPYYVKVIYDKGQQETILNRLIKMYVASIKKFIELKNVFIGQNISTFKNKRNELITKSNEYQKECKNLLHDNTKENIVKSLQNSIFDMICKTPENREKLDKADKISNYCVESIIFCSTYFKSSILYQEEEERLVIGTNHLNSGIMMKRITGKTYFEVSFYKNALLELICARDEDKNLEKSMISCYQNFLKRMDFNSTDVKISELPY